MSGTALRVGKVVKRDSPVTVHMLLHMSLLWDAQWNEEKAKPNPDLEVLHKLATLAVWMLGGFCVGLQGKEMPLVEPLGPSEALDSCLNLALS